MFTRFCYSLAFLLIPILLFSQNGKIVLPKSGYYDPLFIAYDSSEYGLTGYLQVDDGNNNNYNRCILYFKSSYINEKGSIPILIYQIQDDSIRYNGVLTVKSPGEIVIKSKYKILPCQTLVNLLDGELFSFSEKRNYCRISLIGEQKQHLYKSDQVESKLKSYLVKFDPVGIVKKKGDWVLIHYLRNEKIEGWIPSSALLF